MSAGSLTTAVLPDAFTRSAPPMQWGRLYDADTVFAYMATDSEFLLGRYRKHGQLTLFQIRAYSWWPDSTTALVQQMVDASWAATRGLVS